MVDKFSLTAVIRAVLAESLTPDVVTLSTEVLRRIRKTDQRAALEQALPQVIRSEIRLQAPSFTPPQQQPPASATPPEELAKATANATEHPTAENQPRSFDGTWGKAKAYRDWYEQLQWHPLKGEHEDKFIRDFTLADVRAAAARRMRHGATVIANGHALNAVGDLMVEHGVDLWRDLPDAIAREVAPRNLADGQ